MKRALNTNLFPKQQRRISRLAASLQISPLARSLKLKGLTYLSNRKLLNLERCLRSINSNSIVGDILEFGVALGGSGILLASQMGENRRYFGFDVFGMIPPPNPAEDSQDSIDRYDEIASGNSKGIAGRSYYGYEKDLLDKVRSEFSFYGLLNGEKVQFVKGLFSESWPYEKEKILNVAIVHIDCDWHDPVAYCLAHAAQLVTIGGFIIVDDYYDYVGAQKAVDEFLCNSTNFEILKRSENLIIRRIT